MPSKPSKSPAKGKARPKPTPKKKPISSPYVDDEADESDEGVMVDRPSSPPPRERAAVDQSQVEDTDLDDELDESFINDGDPFEDLGDARDEEESFPASPPPSRSKFRGRPVKQSVVPPETPSPSKKRTKSVVSEADSIEDTPHPLTSKRRGRAGRPSNVTPSTPSPSKKRTKASVEDDVIELDSSSEEDLEAMDVDDSMFRKPPGVKASALPPSLTTRSVSRRAATSSQASSDARSPSKKVKTETVSFPGAEPAFLAGLDNKTKEAAAAWMEQIMKGRHETPSRPSAAAVERPDYDQLELAKGLQASLDSAAEISTPTRRRSKGKGRAKPEAFSPDWEPPYAGDALLPAQEPVPPPNSRNKCTTSSGKASRSKNPPQNHVRSPFPLSDADISTFLVKKPLPSVTVAGGSSKGKAPLTMAQFLRASRGEPDPEGEDADDDNDSPPPVVPTVSPLFLEDLETYKANYDPLAPCGVFELAIQDDTLKDSYVGLPPLPALRRILPAYDRNRNSGDDSIDYTTGGRIQYSSWFNQLPRMLAQNSMRAVLFVESEPNFINLSRVSPIRLSSRVSAGSSTTQRLYVDARIAVCVSTVCVTESHLVVARKIGARSERRRKTISGVFHDQEWERFESIINLVFGNTIMYSQITDKAIAFQTMISPDKSASSDPPAPGLPASMFSARSPTKHAATSSTSSPRIKTLLAYDDPVPVYDARKIVVDFDADLDRLANVLPPFVGEIPPGSFAVIGYSCSSYAGTVVGNAAKVPNVGLNVLWVIVCGIPSA